MLKELSYLQTWVLKTHKCCVIIVDNMTVWRLNLRENILFLFLKNRLDAWSSIPLAYLGCFYVCMHAYIHANVYQIWLYSIIFKIKKCIRLFGLVSAWKVPDSGAAVLITTCQDLNHFLQFVSRTLTLLPNEWCGLPVVGQVPFLTDSWLV